MGFLRRLKGLINATKNKSDSNFDEDKRIDDHNIEKIAELENRIVLLESKISQLSDLSQKYSELRKEVEKLTFSFNAKIGIQKSNTVAQPSQRSVEEIVGEIASAPQKSTTEFHYIKLMNMKGDVEMNDVHKSDAFYELKTFGNNAELRPLPEKSAYLIMQQKYLLEPAFIISGSGQNIIVQTAAKYVLQSGNVFSLEEKGKIELK